MNDLFPDPAPDFSDPIGLLKACHQRILRYCELLENLVNLIKQDPPTEASNKEIVDAANQIKRYFKTAGVMHHQDEEQDFFPLLLRTSMKMADQINSLKQEHKQKDECWKQLESLLSNPANLLSSPDENLKSLEQLSNEFCSLQRSHIEKEEEGFLSLAQHILSKDQLRNIGYSMEERRKSAR